MKSGMAIGLVAASVLLGGWAAQKEYTEERIKDGILMQVLEPDAIPAISAPVFVSVREANKFMADDEPILGLFDGKVAKAYSLWHLDRHEIVNDSLPGLGPVAVTW